MKAIFLDRDGVINKYPGDFLYVTSSKDFEFLPGAKEAIAKLHQNGFLLFIVSNQAGVGKGIYSQAALDAITAKMLQGIEQAGGKISAVYYCTHRPEDNCPCRKPKAGQIEKAKERWPLDLKNSYFIGDTIRDIETGKAAGLKTILVFSGKEKPENKDNWQYLPDFTAADLSEVAKIIIKE